jgi:hypothetical protein
LLVPTRGQSPTSSITSVIPQIAPGRDGQTRGFSPGGRPAACRGFRRNRRSRE